MKDNDSIIEKFKEVYKSNQEFSKWESTLNRFRLKSYLLAESYSKTDEYTCLSVLMSLKLFLNNEITKDDYDFQCKKNRLNINIIKGTQNISGFYDTNTKKITIFITSDIIDEICNCNNVQDLKKIADNIWTAFVHEDTHMQQDSKSCSKFKNKYVNLEDNFDYFNQKIEADAYGREIGARLKKIYPKKSVLNIFLKVNSNDISDDYSKKLIEIYKDPRVDKNVTKHFFRALYDFLEENEL